ncbi:MAG: hypothetical protein FWD53_07890 [Phycisphaerales bacterium]|nr:hypothetical protein [Phycisphaerales bacterium]
MSIARFTTVVDERRHLSVTLPPDIQAGQVEVIVWQASAEAKRKGVGGGKGPSDETHAALLAFHKGRQLNGLTLKQLKEEGRR